MHSPDLPHSQQAVHYTLFRGAALAYVIFGVIAVALALRLGEWVAFALGILFFVVALVFWVCSRWLARNQRVKLAVRLGAICLLVATTAFAITARPELPASGAMIYVLVMLYTSLADSRRAAWAWCMVCIVLYLASIGVRQSFFGLDYRHDLGLALSVYLFPPMLYVLATFIATDLGHHLRATVTTSIGLRNDLRTRTAQYEQLLNTMNEGFIVIDEDDRFEHINDRFCEIFGVTRAEVIGQRYHDLGVFDPVNLAVLREQKKMRMQRLRTTYELQVTRRDNRRFTVLVSAVPNVDAAGIYRGASCVILDITERKAAEEALRAERAQLSRRVEESTANLRAAYNALSRELHERQQAEAALGDAEAEYRLLFDRVPIGLYRASLDGQYQRVNPALLALLGYRDEAEACSAAKSSPANWYTDPARAGEFRQRLAEEGYIAGFESEIRRHGSDDRIWISESAVIVRDGAGKSLYYQGVVEDITARKRVELQQERLITELARVTQMKDEFLASMSHELRTPLNGILNLTELLREQIYGSINGRQQRALAAIEESGQHLLSLITDILDLAKMDAEQAELIFQPVLINKLCQASIKFIQPAAQKKRIRVYFTPDATVDVLLVDEMRIKQVLINLLGNAVKFSPERGAIGLEVQGIDGEEPVVQLVVWDTGVGIPEADLERIFRPFVQVDSRLAREHEGTGLGLALVAQMAEMHGGSVSVESQVERGSRFTVTLPWRKPAPDNVLNRDREGVALTDPVEPPTGHLTTSTSPLLLLVATDPGTIQMLKDYLRFKEYIVEVCPNLASAIALASQQRPAMIVVDLAPADGDALLFGAQARRSFADVPLIILTAQLLYSHPAPDASQAVTYLSKPVGLHDLTNAIEANLVGKPKESTRSFVNA